MTIIEELKRRNVFRMALLYIVSSWLILQVADVLAGLFGLPDWSMRFVGFLLLLGFPVALVFSWIYELTPEGLKREKEVEQDESITRQTGQKINMAIVVLLAVAVALFALDRFGGTRTNNEVASGETPSAGFEGERAASRSVPGGRTREADEVGFESIAVLPFVNMSSDAENEYFADGLTETLLHKLAQVSELRVAARTSSFAFKGTAADVREIAEKLSVANVLEGSVQRAGDKVRITAQLIQASDGYHLWSATYDRSLDDIFVVQDEIATEVTKALKGSLLGEETVEIANDGGTNNPEAYDAYLRGLDAYREQTEASLEEAVRLMRKAVVLDPGFALAWSGLAKAINTHGTYAGISFLELESEIFAAAEKGVELAPDVSTTVTTLGALYRDYRENAKARALLERAIDLDPNNPVAWSRLADLQFSTGKFDTALASAQKAMTLDPLDFELKADSTYKFLQTGRVQEAELLAQAILDHNSDSVNGLSALGNIYWRTGRPAKALETYQQLLEINPNTAYIMDRIADSYIELGDTDSATRWLDRAAEINPDQVLNERSWICRIAGDMDCAIRMLEQWLTLFEEEDRRAWLQAEISMLKGDWQSALDLNRRAVELNKESEQDIGEVFNQLDIAWAADTLGQSELRDQTLAEARARMQEWLDNGSRSQYTLWFLADAAAIEGDAVASREYLEKAIETGFRNLPYVLHSGVYEKVLADPGLQALLAELREINFRELQAMQAVDKTMEGQL